MIKVFTTNKEGKIELTKEELKNLLDEAYWDGYKANSGTFTYHSPYIWSNTTATDSNIWTLNTVNASTITNGTIDKELYL